MLAWISQKLLRWLFKRYLDTPGGKKLKAVASGFGIAWGGSAAAGGILSGLRGEWLDLALSIVIPLYGAVTSIIKAF